MYTDFDPRVQKKFSSKIIGNVYFGFGDRNPYICFSYFPCKRYRHKMKCQPFLRWHYFWFYHFSIEFCLNESFIEFCIAIFVGDSLSRFAMSIVDTVFVLLLLGFVDFFKDSVSFKNLIGFSISLLTGLSVDVVQQPGSSRTKLATFSDVG